MIKSYVRRNAHFSKSQQHAYNNYRAAYTFPFREELLDLQSIFAGKEIYLELGFGMGDATWQLAQNNPHNIYLGFELHKPGIGKLLKQCHAASINNIKIIEHDAIEALQDMIPNDSIAGIHIFFPDPWPKKKHHKRRLLNQHSLQLFQQKLKAGAYLYFVTDWEPYAQAVQSLVHPLFKNNYEKFSPPQAWRPQTGFERKALRRGAEIFELFLVKG